MPGAGRSARSKALLIAGDDAGDAARWALDAGAAEAESPIGRYAAVLALLVLGRDEEAREVAATLGRRIPERRRRRARGARAPDPAAYGTAVASVRRSFEDRDSFLEDVPVPDTALALDVLASRRFT